MDTGTIIAIVAAAISGLAAMISVAQTALARSQAVSSRDSARSAKIQAQEARRQSRAAEEQLAQGRIQIDEQRRENSAARLDLLTIRVDDFAAKAFEWSTATNTVAVKLINGGYTSAPASSYAPCDPQDLIPALSDYSDSFAALTKATRDTVRFHGQYREIVNATGETLRLAQNVHSTLMPIVNTENPSTTDCDAALIQIAHSVQGLDNWLRLLNARLVRILTEEGKV